MKPVDPDELEVFFTEVASDSQADSREAAKPDSGPHVTLTVSFVIVVHLTLLFLMTSLNRSLISGFAVDEFPLLHKPNPLVVASSQFFFSSLVFLPFCWRQFVRSLQACVGGVLLTSLPYIASITSSLTIGYFFNPPPYFQVRSDSISAAFFIGFFNKHFYNFPDTLIAASIMICGTLLSSGRSTEFYFPFLIFGFASSAASVQYPFAIRKSIRVFRRRLILFAFTLNVCSFLIILPFTWLFADFSIFRRRDFELWSFFRTLICSGVIAAILCLTSSMLIYFSSPLHYVALSTVRSSLSILVQAFRNPVKRVLTPGTFIGHLVCVGSGVMVVLFHLGKIRQKTAVPWAFPASLWRLLGAFE
jgi:hypothetical protein